MVWRLAQEVGGVTIQVSLTHSATSAGAVAVVVGQAEHRAGDAPLELLGALHVAGLLELAGVHAQIAIS